MTKRLAALMAPLLFALPLLAAAQSWPAPPG
jgi:hypothetical protein